MGPEDSTAMTCRYVNPFSRVNECRQYFGGWTNEQVNDACGAVFTGVSGTMSSDPCLEADAIGVCATNPTEAGLFYKIWFYGGDPEITGRLCGDFLDGSWEDFGGGDTTPMTTNMLMDEALEFLESTPSVRITPSCNEISCLDELIEDRGGIEFTPVDSNPTVGLIIYPGAQVDPRAYAPIGRAVAEQGIIAIIVPMPDMFALNGWDRANSIIEAHPEVQSWYLAGHSMGGAMTAHFAKMYPGVMKGLILWAAYPGAEDDLSETDEHVMSIFGNMDGVATIEEVELSKPLLPADTQYVEIKGGNHAQFGLYGPQDGDLDADIPARVQHQQIVGASLHFIGAIQANNSMPKNPIFELAPSTAWCHQAQSIIAGIDPDGTSQHFSVNSYSQVEQFAESKPGSTENEMSPFVLSAYVREHGNPNRLDAPPILPREVWCKLKSREFVLAELDMTSTHSETSCRDVNKAAVDWAKAQLPNQLRARLDTMAFNIDYLADKEFETGPEWLSDGDLLVEEHSTDGQSMIQIRSASLKVDSQGDIPESERFPAEDRDVVYCKALAPAEAFRRLMIIAEDTND
ncbi:MAG: alpha/beta hydrolase [Myxococcota bacterium]|nr:alpha/beta hydrolase [Myxococcota bacterium]